MDVKDRINAKRMAAKSAAAAGVDVASAAQITNAPAPAAAPQAGASSRAARFKAAGAGTEAIDPDAPRAQTSNASTVEQAPSRDQDAYVASSVAVVAPSPAPQRPASRAERFKALAPAVAARRDQAMQAQEAVGHRGDELYGAQHQAAMPWDDPSRPAGSAYSEEEWAKVEADNPGCIVLEMVKPGERGLVAMPSDAIDPWLSRSMVIQDTVESPWKANASARMIHHSEFGAFRYLIVRSENIAKQYDWASGATLVFRSRADEEATDRQPSRAERFRG